MAFAKTVTSPSVIAWVIVAFAALGGLALARPNLMELWRQRGEKEPPPAASGSESLPIAIEILPRVVELNGIRTAAVTRPTRKRELQLRGQINFDRDSLAHVRARFPGQIIELGRVDDPHADVSTESLKTKRDLTFMDHVTKGQQLAVLWSKELGEKKSELVAALVRRRLDSRNLLQLRRLEKEGAGTNRSVREAEYDLETDESNIQKARLTLQSWLLSPEEIAEVESEADRLHREQGKRAPELDREWARVNITAPRDGTIVEKNVVEGDIVDINTDLFKIANLSRLLVIAHVYEEDIPFLHALPRPIPWSITINAMPDREPITGVIDRLGDVIDPYVHMALVFGKIENAEDDLLAGQFITASVELPEDPELVEIPTRALVEDGLESAVLVQVDPKKYRFIKRRVLVARRYYDVVYIDSRLTPEQKQQGLEELHVGELVVAAGALELKAALEQQ
jgi:membrane fusion protein, heavy metal efflux system